MNYLEKLKSKVKNSENMPTPHTALTALSTLDSKGSTMGSHIWPVDIPEKTIRQQPKIGTKPIINPIKDQGKEIHGKCHALDQTTGLCYSYAVFDAKPGQPKQCNPDGCQIKRERKKNFIKRGEQNNGKF